MIGCAFGPPTDAPVHEGDSPAGGGVAVGAPGYLAESAFGRALLEDGKVEIAESLVSRLVAQSPAFVLGQRLLARIER